VTNEHFVLILLSVDGLADAPTQNRIRGGRANLLPHLAPCLSGVSAAVSLPAGILSKVGG